MATIRNREAFMSKEVTIIVPTYNEEENIDQCLQSIFNQNMEKISKVIIADNNSRDNTVEITKKYDVTTIKGGSPATARNNGARHSQTKYLLFLDADTILPDNFFETALNAFNKKKLKVASFYIKPDPVDFFNKILFYFYNKISFFIAQLSLPFITTAGCCILVEKNIHDSVNGFCENMKVLEEYDYIKKIKKYGKFRVIPVYVFTSTRRFLPGSRLKHTLILIIYYIKWLITGTIKNDFLGYWKEHDEQK